MVVVVECVGMVCRIMFILFGKILVGVCCLLDNVWVNFNLFVFDIVDE